MRTNMQRTITMSEIFFATTKIENGDVVVKKHEPRTVVGKVTEKNAHKFLPEILNPLITEIKYSENSYEMDLTTFIEHATLTETKEVE